MTEAQPKKIALGTVQFGLRYGISNTVGQPTHEQAQDILDQAHQLGVDTLDTAAGYGCSEDVLGQLHAASRFNIITKTAPVAQESIDDTTIEHLAQVFDASLNKLQSPAIKGLLVHQAADLLKPGSDNLYKLLERTKAQGLVKKIGVSVYSPSEADEIFSRYPLDLIQLPLNILDQEALHSGTLERLHARGVEIHTRSVFLQGALLMQPSQLPPHLGTIRKKLTTLAHASQERGWSAQEACLRFVLGIKYVDKLVCGVNTAAELKELVGNARYQWDGFDFSAFRTSELSIIHPHRWPKAA